MQTKKAIPKYNLHPIRLQFIHLKRLLFQANTLPEALSPELFEFASSGHWTINVTGQAQANRATVVATLICSFDTGTDAMVKRGGEQPESTHKPKEDPYTFEIEAVAGFTFDPEEISQKEVDEWCKLGSFFIIVPYMRHWISEITRDSGFPEILLPLLEVPTFRPPLKKAKTPSPKSILPEANSTAGPAQKH